MSLKLSNVVQFAELAKTESALLVGPLLALEPLIAEIKAKKTGCNCNRSIDYGKWREKFEVAMQLLNSTEMNTLKAVLHTDEICYNYKNTEGSISLICF